MAKFINLRDILSLHLQLLKHWFIENQLYWCLDVIFCTDASKAKKDNFPLNLNALRKTTMNLVSQAQYKRISKKQLMFKETLKRTLFLDIFLTLFRFLLKSECCCRAFIV